MIDQGTRGAGAIEHTAENWPLTGFENRQQIQLSTFFPLISSLWGPEKVWVMRKFDCADVHKNFVNIGSVEFSDFFSDFFRIFRISEVRLSTNKSIPTITFEISRQFEITEPSYEFVVHDWQVVIGLSLLSETASSNVWLRNRWLSRILAFQKEWHDRQSTWIITHEQGKFILLSFHFLRHP